MTLLETQISLNTWIPAAWEEFVKIADDPASTKLKGYYYEKRMRFEPMSTGADHSDDHLAISMSVGIYAALKGIRIKGRDGCSYRKTGVTEFQPDLSYYIGDRAKTIPRGTRVVDLNIYPLPDLVVEISDTSLSDDLGEKRLQYEDLGIPEYWNINVRTKQILAFSLAPDGTIRRIRESIALPGLKLEILEQALQLNDQEEQSAMNIWLMTQFQNQ
ncbi:Uma2 family endonuclease [Leptolyngbya sp. AN03gr2]|uniref:Uma2 family endonuclease n=1 Tax=unclassified Leptolyngbya TaxID=2650499 RepID=UPI003D3131FF